MAKPKIWLLLVGINFYPDKAQRLCGAINDIVDIELALKEYFKEITVTKLLASVTGESGQDAPPEDKHLWPTWDNFTNKLQLITQETSEGDIVWVHYSGHGTLLPTRSSEFVYQEGYGTDAALVLLEPTGQRGVRYLRGIELALLLDTMVHKGLKLTVVLDSCYSGSISRGEDLPVRGIPWSVEVDSEFPSKVPGLCKSPASKEKILRDAATTSHWLLHPHGYTLLAACGPHERAKEIKFGEKQQIHGALSHLLCKALNFFTQNEIQNVTHELIYRHIGANMSSKVAGQHPIFIGTRKTTLRGAEVLCLDVRSTFEIIKVSADQGIWMNAGHAHGVCTGDEYGVYNHAEPEELVTCIIVTDVGAVHSVARCNSVIGSEGSGLQVEVGYRTILTKLARPRAFVKLCSGTDGSWEEKLEENIWLQHLHSDELVPVDTPCFSAVKTNSYQYDILDFKDEIIRNLPPLLLSNLFVRDHIFIILEHLSKYTLVQNLENRRTNSLAGSDFTITIKPQADHLNVERSENSFIVPHDSKVDIEFQNLTQNVLYFSVLNLTPLRRIKQLYPKHTEYQTVMPCNPREVLPKEMPDMVLPGVVMLKPRMTVPTRLRAHQQGSVGADDVLKFIISTCPIRGTRNMELPDLWDAIQHGIGAVRSADEAFGVPLQNSLVEKSKGPGQLGGEETLIRWACRSITIRTVFEAT